MYGLLGKIFIGMGRMVKATSKFFKKPGIAMMLMRLGDRIARIGIGFIYKTSAIKNYLYTYNGISGAFEELNKEAYMEYERKRNLKKREVDPELMSKIISVQVRKGCEAQTGSFKRKGCG